MVLQPGVLALGQVLGTVLEYNFKIGSSTEQEEATDPKLPLIWFGNLNDLNIWYRGDKLIS